MSSIASCRFVCPAQRTGTWPGNPQPDTHSTLTVAGKLSIRATLAVLTVRHSTRNAQQGQWPVEKVEPGIHTTYMSERRNVPAQRTICATLLATAKKNLARQTYFASRWPAPHCVYDFVMPLEPDNEPAREF